MAEEVHDNPTDWVAKQIRTIVESGGEKGNRFYGHDVLLLTTRGRRSQLWERLAAEVPQYASYQKKLGSRRELPVVIVERD
jgi:hypothetical protein